MIYNWQLPFFVALLFTLLCVTPAPAEEPATQQPMRIELQLKEGGTLPIGTLQRHSDGSVTRFEVSVDGPSFEDQFLSMRPFRCLPHPVKTLCYLPYPYENRQQLTTTDLTDLEYSLLFLFKSPADYGINAWNGLYFRLQANQTGFSGQLFETNLDVLASPPEDGNYRPIEAEELYPAADDHWVSGVIIH